MMVARAARRCEAGRRFMADSHPLHELQRVDAEADALRARRDALPERALLRDAETEGAALSVQHADALTRHGALAREEHRIETAVTDARTKAQEIEASLYSGNVKVVKELQALQAELRAFQQRQREHEEAELGLMEQQEQQGAEIAALDARRAALAKDVAGWQAALAAAEAEIDAELARLDVARAAVLPGIVAAVMATYEKLRAMPRLKGRVVAQIESETCNGCWGAVPIAFATRFAQQAPDATTECPRCGRLLLR
jgi:predicted  nucleic acid-binding Zn-ribbon protein